MSFSTPRSPYMLSDSHCSLQDSPITLSVCLPVILSTPLSMAVFSAHDPRPVLLLLFYKFFTFIKNKSHNHVCALIELQTHNTTQHNTTQHQFINLISIRNKWIINKLSS
ncbi:hypothetical protein XENOCAPTIV_002454 [Xenoophorus captivus]|uniref:Uncharacterized protein n=1 Tax=Xenoophorus captivus TaxID=1517983 RepID=A0ABV0QY23_9TELE